MTLAVTKEVHDMMAALSTGASGLFPVLDNSAIVRRCLRWFDRLAPADKCRTVQFRECATRANRVVLTLTDVPAHLLEGVPSDGLRAIVSVRVREAHAKMAKQKEATK